MEARIARLESDVAHLRSDVAEIKVDLRTLRDRMETRTVRLESKLELSIDRSFFCLLSLGVASVAGMLGAMARGFGWV